MIKSLPTDRPTDKPEDERTDRHSGRLHVNEDLLTEIRNVKAYSELNCRTFKRTPSIKTKSNMRK